MSSIQEDKDKATLENLQKDIKTTYKTRHIASTRLSVESFFHMLLITATSILLIYNTLNNNNDIITIISSIIVISFSLIIFGIDPSTKSKLLYLCALELTELSKKIQFKIEGYNEKKIENILSEYQKILIRYGINHDDIDYKIYTIKEKKEQTKKCCLVEFFKSYWLYFWLYKFVFIDIVIFVIISYISVFVLKK